MHIVWLSAQQVMHIAGEYYVAPIWNLKMEIDTHQIAFTELNWKHCTGQSGALPFTVEDNKNWNEDWIREKTISKSSV